MAPEASSQRFDRKRLATRWAGVMASQPPAVEVALAATMGGVQGGALGYLLGQLTKSSVQQAGAAGAANAGMSQMMAQLQASGGGVWSQTRGLAALCGVSAGMGVALKKWRKKEDVWNQVYSGVGGGAAFTVASGNLSTPAIVSTALMLGGINAAFYQIAKMFQPDYADNEYEKGQYMLQNLGLVKYAKNLKRGSLVDSTIMLWNDSALQEVRIPPGPRLLILHHIDQYRNRSRMSDKQQPLPMPAFPAPSALKQ